MMRQIPILSRLLLRPPKRLSGPLALGQRNIYVLPTRWGFAFAGVILLMLLISTHYNNNLGFILAFTLAALALASAVHGQRNLAGLVLQADTPLAVFAGQTLCYSLQVENQSGRPRFALQAYSAVCPRSSLDCLDAGSSAALILSAQVDKRGYHQPGRIVLESRYPLGLFRIWSRFTFDWQGLAYPQPAADYQPFPLEQGGSTGSVSSGDNDLSHFRAYQAGDPLKHIHWKGYAKGHGLLTRVYQQQSQAGNRLWLDWQSLNETGVEAKLSRLCRWVLQAEQAGLQYGLRLPGREIAPDRGQAHRDICLQALALFPP